MRFDTRTTCNNQRIFIRRWHSPALTAMRLTPGSKTIAPCVCMNSNSQQASSMSDPSTLSSSDMTRSIVSFAVGLYATHASRNGKSKHDQQQLQLHLPQHMPRTTEIQLQPAATMTAATAAHATRKGKSNHHKQQIQLQLPHHMPLTKADPTATAGNPTAATTAHATHKRKPRRNQQQLQHTTTADIILRGHNCEHAYVFPGIGFDSPAIYAECIVYLKSREGRCQ